jgi:hypothetical protein
MEVDMNRHRLSHIRLVLAITIMTVTATYWISTGSRSREAVATIQVTLPKSQLIHHSPYEFVEPPAR